jgi:hypothetical protein
MRVLARTDVASSSVISLNPRFLCTTEKKNNNNNEINANYYLEKNLNKLKFNKK